MMRKVISLSAAILLVFSLQLSAFAAYDTLIPLYLDGAKVTAGAAAEDEVLFLPVRAVCEALGYKVVWSKTDEGPIVTVTGTGKTVILDLTSQKITDNGHEFYIYGAYAEGLRALANGVYLESGQFADCFGLQVQYDKANNTVSVTRVAPNPIQISTMKLDSDNEDLTVSLQYPQITGLENNEIQNQINTVFRSAAANCVNQGLSTAFDLRQVRAENPDYTNKCGAYFNYQVKYNQNGLLSVVLQDYQYAGGAHGGTLQFSYTFDLKTGKALQLADLMKSGSGYVPTINAAVRTQIDQRVAAGDLYEFEDSPFETIGSKPDYYLSSDGVTVYFQEYAYFPYAAGIQEFTVPYGDLSGMMATAYSYLYNQPAVLLPAPADNTLAMGETGKVILKGNPTTGYTWHVKIEDGGILKQTSNSYASDSGLIGSGGTYTWAFKAQKKGTAKLTFTYYREFEGAASVTADNTVVYTVTVG